MIRSIAFHLGVKFIDLCVVLVNLCVVLVATHISQAAAIGDTTTAKG